MSKFFNDWLTRRFMAGGGSKTPVFYDYIQATGNDCAINTGYILPENAVIAVTSVMGAYGSRDTLCGAYDGTGYTYMRQVGHSGSSRWGWSYDSGTQTAKNLGQYYNPAREMGTLWMSPSYCGQGDNGSGLTKGGTKPNSCFYILSIGQDNTLAYQGRFGTVYVYGSEAAGITGASQLASYTPVATFRPCTYGGQPGVWHIEGDSFCPNMGTSPVVVFNAS